MRAAPALLVLLAACGSFGSAAEPVNTPAEAGASSDAGAPDASSPDASSPDASASDDGGNAAVCKPSSTSCLDFENGLKPFPGWTQEANNGQAPLIVGGMMATQLVPPSTSEQALASRLTYDLTTKPNHTRISFRVKVDGTDAIAAGKQITLAEFFCHSGTDGASYAGALVNVQTNWELGATLLTEEPFPFKGGSTTLKPDSWTAITLDVVWSGAGAHYDLAVDQALVSQGPVTADQYCPGRTTFSAFVGLGSATAQGAKAFYDDVVLDLLP